MEEAAKQKEQEVKDAKNGGSSTTSKVIAEGVKQGMSKVQVNTNVNTGGVGQGVDKSNEVITLGSLQKDVRDDQRKSRDHMDAINQSSAAMQAYLKGKMSPEVAAKFEEKMIKNGWTKQDFQKATENALKAQLLTHTQAVEQQKAIIEMKTMLEKLGLK